MTLVHQTEIARLSHRLPIALGFLGPEFRGTFPFFCQPKKKSQEFLARGKQHGFSCETLQGFGEPGFSDFGGWQILQKVKAATILRFLAKSYWTTVYHTTKKRLKIGLLFLVSPGKSVVSTEFIYFEDFSAESTRTTGLVNRSSDQNPGYLLYIGDILPSYLGILISHHRVIGIPINQSI